MITHAMEDYLKAIYLLQKGEEKVSTTAIAEQMNVSAPSVTGMIRKLTTMGLIDHTSYQGVQLTEGGKKVAKEVLRHHRLLELYLVEIMGFTWDKVHDEADKLEHVISEEFEEKMSDALGHPTTDPHGHAIPAKDGAVKEVSYETLAEVEPGSFATVEQVNDNNPEMLRYLDNLEIVPGALVQVVAKEPFNGPLHLKIDQAEHFIGLEVAHNVFVEVSEKEAN
ncbi:MAG: metal-dependent transcriptional regulator [Candidatus Poribacteria bacterium]|nr:metal-dependent transcriptional regulator [Candidatus Poribacteria bacterium]